jgi:hypothetical protein
LFSAWEKALSYRNLSIDELISKAGSSNRRATVRYQCAPATPVRIRLTGVQELQGWVLDLSARGVGVQLEQPVTASTHVLLQIKSKDSKKSFELAARVVHATMTPCGEWHVGCELLRQLTPEDLDQLL